MWDLPGPGLEPVSPALAGGFVTTAPPGKAGNTFNTTVGCMFKIDVLCCLSVPVLQVENLLNRFLVSLGMNIFLLKHNLSLHVSKFSNIKPSG